MSDMSDRITIIRETYCHGSNTEMAAAMGVTPQQVSNLCRGYREAGRASRMRILRAFPEVREQWLALGIGRMTKEEQLAASLEDEVRTLRELLAERDRIIEEQAAALADLRAMLPIMRQVMDGSL